MQHSFDILIAEKYGINVAIFLNHLAFWIKKNQANNKHFHDGRYWTYNSVQAYSLLFPYWTPKQMRLILNKAKEAGLVVVNNYNSTPYDRTQWYSLSDEGHQLLGLAICPLGQIDSGDRANGIGQKGKPIPDNKPDTKPYLKSLSASGDAQAQDDLKLNDDFDEFWKIYPNKKNKPRAKKNWEKIKPADRVLILAHLKVQLERDRQYRGDPEFVPHASTYLNNRRWEDQINDYQVENKKKLDVVRQTANTTYSNFRDFTQERLDEEARANYAQN